jgi:hypothetical protein
MYIALLVAVLPAAARSNETFAERPSKRLERVQALREKAQREKAEARTWALARGIPMRHDNGVRVKELMAVRNGRPIYYTTHNRDAAVSTAADVVRDTAPYQVSGAGVKVGVWDGGSVYAGHQEFGSRVTLRDPTSPYGVNYHATHVAGTIGAHGYRASAKGMAPGTLMDSYDWLSDESEMAAAGSSHAGEEGRIYLSNHSYGTVTGWDGNYFEGDWYAGVDPFFGQYNTAARDWDEIVYDAPYYLPFKSAGNDRNDNPANGSTVYYYEGRWISTIYTNTIHPGGDGVYKAGYDTISTKGNAKNIMTVGAVNDAVSGSSRSLTSPHAQMASFSGWGPADDGRIKPDIVANGIGLDSCDDDSASAYASRSGTSMASPNACGSAALLVEYYDRLFPGQAMRASTLKGLIIHTADDLGNPGPDYSYGWGLMNTLAAVELLQACADNPVRLTEETLSGSRRSSTYTIFSNGVQPIRVTLCWTDPPGLTTSAHDSRTPVLVNDLDLKVEGPGGSFRPYRLDYTNPSAHATADSENNVDNVEQVYIAAPTAGQYTITVDYDGSLTGGTQWYSLLISGPDSDADGDGMPDAWETTYFLSPTGAIAAADSDNDGADNLTEYITGYNPLDPGSVFEVTSFSAPAGGSAPFILNWNSVAGRLYSVSHTENPVFPGFDVIPGAVDLPHTQNSYTDAVERLGPVHFYRVDVRLDQ